MLSPEEIEKMTAEALSVKVRLAKLRLRGDGDGRELAELDAQVDELLRRIRLQQT